MKNLKKIVEVMVDMGRDVALENPIQSFSKHVKAPLGKNDRFCFTGLVRFDRKISN